MKKDYSSQPSAFLNFDIKRALSVGKRTPHLTCLQKKNLNILSVFGREKDFT